MHRTLITGGALTGDLKLALVVLCYVMLKIDCLRGAWTGGGYRVVFLVAAVCRQLLAGGVTLLWADCV
jgi:hypothetical protein